MAVPEFSRKRWIPNLLIFSYIFGFLCLNFLLLKEVMLALNNNVNCNNKNYFQEIWKHFPNDICFPLYLTSISFTFYLILKIEINQKFEEVANYFLIKKIINSLLLLCSLICNLFI